MKTEEKQARQLAALDYLRNEMGLQGIADAIIDAMPSRIEFRPAWVDLTDFKWQLCYSKLADLATQSPTLYIREHAEKCAVMLNEAYERWGEHLNHRSSEADFAIRLGAFDLYSELVGWHE